MNYFANVANRYARVRSVELTAAKLKSIYPRVLLLFF